MNILTPIDWSTGYGITGYNIWYELYKKNNQTTLFPIGSGNAQIDWDMNAIKDSINNRLNLDKYAPCLKIWYPNDFFLRSIGGGKYGGLSFFEINKLTKLEIQSYSVLDVIFVASNWAKNVLIEHGINNDIIVSPLGVDTNIFNAAIPKDKEYDKYVFINIGKWEIRKGHDVLVDIFNKAFTKDDNVELWMLNENHFLNEEQAKYWYYLYKGSELADKIKFYPKLPTQQILSQIIGFADCGIYPSRGEGWNNELLETMAMNKPVITTNYSAHTEYCNDDNAFLVDINEFETAIDDIFFHGYGEWAAINQDTQDSLIEHMRYVYKNNIRTNQHGLETAKKYSWINTANIIHDELCTN